jgi:hypothetical protein
MIFSRKWKRSLQGLGVDGMIILQWTLRKTSARVLDDSMWLKMRCSDCECGNEPSGFIKAGQIS